MSLWTCVACSARRAVDMLLCPQCGAAEHEVGDTISGAEGGQGQPHVAPAYADAAPAAPAPAAEPAAVAPATAETLQQAGYSPTEVQAQVAPADEPPPPEPSTP